MSVVSIKNVSKTYGSNRTAVKAVSNVSLEINPGEVILIIGPSGSGKTTLLSMIGTLLSPTEGQIVVDGVDVVNMSSGQLAHLRLMQYGFIFQSSNLLSALSAQQNVAVPLLAAGVNKKQATKAAKNLLEKLHLGERLNNLPRNLSGGEKQRVAIARALANNPKVILADEPTASLDSKTGHEIMQLLCDTACDEGRAVVIVSHDLRLKDIAHRVITIEDGKLALEVKGNHDIIAHEKGDIDDKSN